MPTPPPPPGADIVTTTAIIMKAVLFHEFGGPEVLRYETVPDPEPKAGQVRVRLKASSLNHLDLFLRGGEREKNIPLPHIPGCDGAGVVDAIGAGVTGFAAGDRVFISPGMSCGTCSACTGNRETFCPSYHVLGTRENGTYAEFVCVPATNLGFLPDKLSFNEGAAVPLVFLTAWHMLVTRAEVQAGETVLVQGAGSGIGSAAIQIAKLHGARVITTAGSDEKLGKALALGADETINYRSKDFVAEVRALTGKQGADVIFEHTGGEVFARSITVLGRGGRLVTCGSTTDYMASVDVRYVYSRQQSILGSWMGWRHELDHVMKLFDAPNGNKLTPVIDSVFPLERADDAHRRMESRKNFGKIVLEIP
jgi:NADPH:quinone reductase-like Zn-dependent oxidoreductase